MIEKPDPKKIALLIIDPQNDFLSSGGVVWDKVGNGVKETKVVEHLVELRKTARKVGISRRVDPNDNCCYLLYLNQP